jgi:hypothetical protein
MVTIHCMDSSGTSRKKKREEYSEPSKTPSSIHTPCTFHAVGAGLSVLRRIAATTAVRGVVGHRPGQYAELMGLATRQQWSQWREQCSTDTLSLISVMGI